ncbi:MAG TPA: MupA/Atu3671 family FMN-dependent luciferase-like monooxygenase [Pyrinomonadaceae bacterium]|nr:MupA/Atu3671 family FMN-dependent luciferase-like monooxygenase [Pyrinomonadaceae bacterium]
MLARSQDSPHKSVDFGLFFFASIDSESKNRYQLMIEAAKYADTCGFRFVSTPERHFHRFGGLFPNPAITSAALAAVTNQIEIRACSLVSPLHHVLRIVEDWSVVDNLSNGRLAISFGSGWNVNDFVFAPELYSRRHEIMYDQIEQIRKLWSEGICTVSNPLGKTVSLSLYPRPVQKELPIWITSSGNPETFQAAGRVGANLLTHLENQDLKTLRDKIRLYREARAARDDDAGAGKVTLMQHTFVAQSSEEASRYGETHLTKYLSSAMELESAAVRAGGRMSSGRNVSDAMMSDPNVRQDIVDHASHKYRKSLSLIGSLEECRQRVHQLRSIGVDEIACLIDFIDDPPAVLTSLRHLNKLKDEFSAVGLEAYKNKAISSFLADD